MILIHIWAVGFIILLLLSCWAINVGPLRPKSRWPVIKECALWPVTVPAAIYELYFKD